MFSSVVSILILAISLSNSLNIPLQDDWASVEREVQNQFQSVADHKLSKLFLDISRNCENEQRIVAKLFILNETFINLFEDSKVRRGNDGSCAVSVYETFDDVLNAWCVKQPHRKLVFPYNYTENAVSFEVIVQTSCLHFQSGEDHDRFPLPAPLNVRQDQFGQFFIFTVVILALVGICSIYYCHRQPLFRSIKEIWSVYRDRRDWNDINEIIKFRDKKIKEEHEKRQNSVQTTVL